MDSFYYYNPVKIFFGQGKIAAIAKEIPRDARILMTYGGGSLKNNGIYEQVKAALAQHTVLEFGGILANPELEILIDADNGLIGLGVPQDWSTHMIGHELTALYGLDHAVTLAIILPSLLAYKRNIKGVKLLRYADKVWGITQGNEEERIERAILATRDFFESVGISTRLRDYKLDSDSISNYIRNLEKHHLTPLGECQDIHHDSCCSNVSRVSLPIARGSQRCSRWFARRKFSG
ncbi:MAG: iron-containing alcohol dehydrogenase [Moorea sp. SIO2B7]|nr:iron-containing alcohol dehydrogenase [Moorena sp. SIO2B7]